MIMKGLPKCLDCKHLFKYEGCKAFKEIPHEIWVNEIDHTKPYPGDNGIRFEPRGMSK